MKLSIIVPVYRVERYLDACLDSLAAQQVDGMEILLVDDASPDGSGRLCDRRAREDGRFRVLRHAVNRGLSAARNTGIAAARGEFITFVDSDDFLAPDTLQPNLELLQASSGADVVEYPVSVRHGAPQAYHYAPGPDAETDFTGWVKARGYLHSYAWNKIYRRALWDGVRFPEGRLFEDLLTIPSVLRRARRIVNSAAGLYCYCSRGGSISAAPTLPAVEGLLQARLQLYGELLRQPGLDEADLDEAYLHLCDAQIVLLQLGGKDCIPVRRLPLRRALSTPRPPAYRLKAVLKSLCGPRYCGLVARVRKVLHL